MRERIFEKAILKSKINKSNVIRVLFKHNFQTVITFKVCSFK